MGARTDFEPLSWEEAEQNRRAGARKDLAGLPPPCFPATGPRQNGGPAALAGVPEARIPGESVLEQMDRLRSELKRGKEYLAQIQQDLVESRSLLEEWPAYERDCGRNPLAHLTQSLMVNERIAQFLTEWLQGREAKLEALGHQGH